MSRSHYMHSLVKTITTTQRLWRWPTSLPPFLPPQTIHRKRNVATSLPGCFGIAAIIPIRISVCRNVLLPLFAGVEIPPMPEISIQQPGQDGFCLFLPRCPRALRACPPGYCPCALCPPATHDRIPERLSGLYNNSVTRLNPIGRRHPESLTWYRCPHTPGAWARLAAQPTSAARLIAYRTIPASLYRNEPKRRDRVCRANPVRTLPIQTN